MGEVQLPLTKERIEDLLHEEARLLDRHDYMTWLGLFTADACYVVPLGSDEHDVAIIRDSRSALEERVSRLVGGNAYAQNPRSNTARLIGNVQVAVTGDRAEVEAVFTIVEFRNDIERVYAGRYRYAVVATGDKLRIAAKHVDLVNHAAPLGNLSFLL